jgi:antitoxin component YwqK of YwqJK toxin-antitoxin module
MRRNPFFLLALCALPALAHAKLEACDIAGESVSPNNGSTTAGKTGLMRCRDRESGVVVREREIKNGVFMGAVRYYTDKGELQREHSVNERGNRDGVAREFNGKQLMLEENMRNGSRVGITRRWHTSGALQRVTFYGDDGREQAYAEFTPQGKLRDLRCAAQPQLAPHADDAAWCGHKGGAGTVTLHADDGRLVGSLVHEHGERRRSEVLHANGKPREQVETSAAGGVERSFFDSGTKRRERQWVTKDKRRITTLEREYHESGTLVRERQWQPAADDRASELVLEQQWYLNGQPRAKQAYERSGEQQLRHDTRFHDNGRVSFEGRWLLSGRYDEQARGVHKSFDPDGKLRLERHYDERGHISRERTFDASGQVERDDAVFQDGSRKAFSR